MKKLLIIILIAGITGMSCSHKQAATIPGISDADVLHQNEDQLTQLIIYDVFTPPVASRIYAYASLASYEAIRFQKPEYESLTNQLKGFEPMPEPDKSKKYDFTLAATEAFFTIAKKVTFSLDSLKEYESTVHARFKNAVGDSVYNRSIAFGDQIAQVIVKRLIKDNYLQTRGKPKFLGSEDPGKWRPTPPDYLDGVEYCWGTMKTFALDSSDRIPVPAPPKYSEDKNSEFFKQNVAVYEQSKTLTDEQKDIARYWDDNPFVMEHAGHMTFANKKITPGGHWIGITAIACKQTKADAVKTAQAYALTAVGM
ncbi:MAG: phosphoesterase, partial [Mucilaginibacter sp.]